MINPKYTNKIGKKLVGTLCATTLLFAPQLSAQQFTAPLHIFSGEPNDSTNLFEANYVSMDGFAAFSPLEYFTHDRESFPNLFENENPDEFLSWTFKLAFDYYAPSGEEFQHLVGEDAPPWTPYTEEMARGQHKMPTRGYYVPSPIANDPERRLGLARTSTRVVVPTLHQIPYHAAIQIMDNPNEAVHNKVSRLFDLASMGDKLAFDVSLRAGGFLHNGEKTNFGSAAWYEMMFNGFIDYLEDGEITKRGQLNSLPGGITFVNDITYCGVAKPEGVAGCATVNGTTIAVNYNILKESDATRLGILLHEIGHTQGLEHEEDPNNLMYEKSGDERIAVTKEQAAHFGRRKSNGYTGGYIPWEKAE